MKSVPSSTMEKMAVLKDAGILKGLPFEHLILLARACTVERYAPDQVVFQEGAPADSLYVVVDGKVQIYRDQAGYAVVLSESGRSGLFGEMAIFDDNPRAASVRALDPTVLLRLSREDFGDFVFNHPNVAMECVRLLSQRVRELNDRVQKLSVARGGPLVAPRTTPIITAGADPASRPSPGGGEHP